MADTILDEISMPLVFLSDSAHIPSAIGQTPNEIYFEKDVENQRVLRANRDILDPSEQSYGTVNLLSLL